LCTIITDENVLTRCMNAGRLWAMNMVEKLISQHENEALDNGEEYYAGNMGGKN
jgi:hypothetical protein